MSIGRPAVVAVDVGGTTMKAGIVGPDGIYDVRRIPSGRELGPDAVLDRVGDVVDAMTRACRDGGLEPIGVGVVVPGVVDDRGVGRLSVTLGWRDAPIRARVAACGLPAFVGHDVRAGGVAEALFGAGAGANETIALFVPIGTGIAAAVIRGGRVEPGATFQAGEIGQVLVPVATVGMPEGSPPLVTLEATSSARGVAERYARATGALLESAAADEVSAAVSTGDAIASAVWTEAVDRLAQVLATAIATVDPGVVILGGGLSRAGSTLYEPLGRALAGYLPWRTVPRLTTARFDDEAGLIGCSIEAWRVAGRDPAELAPLLTSETWRAAAVAITAPRGG